MFNSIEELVLINWQIYTINICVAFGNELEKLNLPFI